MSANLDGSPVSATTVNGSIFLSTNRAADAHAVNGSIVAALSEIDWPGTREFRTVNGSVDLELPESCHATVKASTVWGFIQNDFGIPVRRSLPVSWMNGDINGGGPGLGLSTVNGSIHLRRSSAQ